MHLVFLLLISDAQTQCSDSNSKKFLRSILGLKLTKFSRLEIAIELERVESDILFILGLMCIKNINLKVIFGTSFYKL